MPLHDPRVLKLLAPVVPTYDRATRSSAPCLRIGGELYHITVVCLDRQRLGQLFNYGDKKVLDFTRQQVDALDPPAKLGGWILLGTLEEWRPVSSGSTPPSNVVRRAKVPGAPSRYVVPTKIVVETLVYALDRYPPLALPLVWNLHNGVIEVSFHQPLTTQLFRGLNRWKKTPHARRTTFDIFSLERGEFAPAATHPQPGSESFRLQLPLTYIPVFKAHYVTVAEFAGQYSRGVRRLVPMCSMKMSMMNLEFLWPVDMPRRRRYLRANWHVESRGSPEGVVAVRPLLGVEGCTVEEVRWDREENVKEEEEEEGVLMGHDDNGGMGMQYN
ncbi:uncharacterized protein B0H18DRAFT_958754 [Fomitopsis serialis]|uniref:uncharacterized protein n=1 Tax=Fomitopsis serialis TaxID=139415 RepID=UPI0020077D45|nr:uncharacterized protein B0H18DRAFT_958754 [Neoantrodia serialis]KAH9916699.1 hypothetical protein B0H18DRAFT_958754 [Neoantrodia serialis]